MSFDAGPISMDWIAVGARAFALVVAGRIVAIVYWHGAELGEPGGVPAVGDAGFSWVPADLPVDHFFLFAAPNPAEGDWARARETAADAYIQWMHQEAGYIARLRREAAELLSVSPWWQDDRLREQLRSRAWHGRRRSDRR